ncbi:MAG TPA: response regulator [Rhizomicrobium sp.]|nr:response regulator [Rhizomicrobium sp.]
MGAEQRLVFIVEDDAAVRASTRVLLEASGYVMRDFSSAEQLLDAGDLSQAGCIVLDYNLPGMSGIELLESLRAQGDRTPAIIVSSNGKQIVQRAARAGVAAVLRKPITADALTQWLDQIFTAAR